MVDDATQADQIDGGKKGGLLALIKGLMGRNGESHLRDALEELIEESDERETPIASDERVLIANILKFGELTVYDVMVPRADIVAVEVGTNLQDLVGEVMQQPHSRYPVYREVMDDILGVVHIKDILSAMASPTDEFSLRGIMRQTMIVAPSMRVLDLMLQMRLQRRHMALVVDEYGGIDGLITIEDLVEEIVGDIEDEHDEVTGPQMETAEDGTVFADPRLLIEDLEDTFGELLTEEERAEDIDTVGGLVFTLAGRVPTRGELIRHDPSGVEFEVLDADPRRIKRLRLRNLPDAVMKTG